MSCCHTDPDAVVIVVNDVDAVVAWVDVDRLIGRRIMHPSAVRLCPGQGIENTRIKGR